MEIDFAAIDQFDEPEGFLAIHAHHVSMSWQLVGPYLAAPDARMVLEPARGRAKGIADRDCPASAPMGQNLVVE
jgi:hypothetical protein